MRGSPLATAAALGFAGVVLGAFGAHGLEGRLTEARLANWHTAVLYHLVHALALLFASALATPGRSLAVARWSFLLGILLFSGSLYLLALTDVRALGAVTPLGGVAFLVGWGALAVVGLRRRP